MSTYIGYLRITLRRGTLNKTQRVRETIRTLGFGKKGLLNSTVVHANTESVRGMINRIKHMVEVEPIMSEVDALPLQFKHRRSRGVPVMSSSKTIGMEEMKRAFPELQGLPKKVADPSPSQ